MKTRPYAIPSRIENAGGDHRAQRIRGVRDPSEYEESLVFWRYLMDRHLLACHLPNEHSRPEERISLSRIGLIPGMPDYLIFGPFRFQARTWCGIAFAWRTRRVWVTLLQSCAQLPRSGKGKRAGAPASRHQGCAMSVTQSQVSAGPARAASGAVTKFAQVTPSIRR